MVLHHSWVGTPAWQIARAVQRGETSAAAVVAEHLGHAREAGPVVRALRVLREAESLAEAEAVDDQGALALLPLAGVPVLVTDETPVAGLPRWIGPAAGFTTIAERDHEMVRRLRGSGALIIGVARAPDADGDGPTRRPRRGDRGSGGAAAAVAAGLAPLALAPDRLGGVRCCAAAHGLVGAVPESPDGGWHYGVVATTVADAALGLAVAAGRDPGPLPGPGRQRVVVSSRLLRPGGWPAWSPDRASQTAVRLVARALVDLGHDVVVAQPAPGRWPARTGERHRRLVGWLADGGWDVLVDPGRLAAPSSAPGLATVTIPVGVRPDGLPNAVQLIAGPGSQLRLLSLAAQLELLAPWRSHAPGWPRAEDGGEPRWKQTPPAGLDVRRRMALPG